MKLLGEKEFTAEVALALERDHEIEMSDRLADDLLVDSLQFLRLIVLVQGNWAQRGDVPPRIETVADLFEYYRSLRRDRG